MRRSQHLVTRAVETRSYSLAKRGYYRRLRRAPLDLTVVFAMGKTGTTALTQALHGVGVDPVFQVHNLAFPHRLEQDEVEYREQSSKARTGSVAAQDEIVLPFHIWDAQWLLDHMPSTGYRWRVATAVRDPLRRVVSTFFQGGIRQGRVDEESTVASVEAQMRDRWNRLPLRWFEWQLKGVLGIDVYKHAFDPAQGYSIIDGDGCRLLLLRQEDLTLTAPRALAELIGADRPVEVPVSNAGDDKAYARLYRSFIEQVRPPPEAVERAYSSRLVRHFYSAEEIEGFRAFWTRPRSNEQPART